MKRTWIYTGWAVVLIAAVLLVACGPKATPTPAEEPPAPAEVSEPVTLRIGTDYIVDTLNVCTTWYGYTTHAYIHDYLWQRGTMDEYGPGLAESYETSDDGLVWTWHIREGVTFHDGVPFDAEAAAWSLNWIKEHEIPTMISGLTGFDKAVAVDATTLEVYYTEAPGTSVSQLLLDARMMPPHIWGEMSEEQIVGEGDPLDIGTGPYKLVSYTPEENMVLEANPDYWGGDLAIDRIIYQQYTNMDAAVQALIAGEVDVVQDVPSTAVDVLKEHSNISIIENPSAGLNELIINSHEEGTQPKWLLDPVVRLAIAHAVDKQQIVNAVWLGHAVIGDSIISPAMGKWRNPNIEDIPYDPDEGNRLLEEASFVDSDGDGIRESLEGEPMELRFYAEEGPVQARTLEIISNGLQQIGISATPTVMDAESMIALYPACDFDLLYWDWSISPLPDFILSVFTCAEREEGGWSDSCLCDPEYERLYAEQASEINVERRVELIHEMQQYLFDQRPYVVISHRNRIGAYRNDRFTGFLDQENILRENSLLQVRPVE
ncbi:MAG: ABC transporter substrate-binding protein [Chloroflexota bacterium]|nr:ABC transporter substrate-binding protein [Chloroflexota bacterium]